jgi:hypothetical protein
VSVEPILVAPISHAMPGFTGEQAKAVLLFDSYAL